ncbi:MAG: Uma2 family endonuclease [Chloroflexota bacterium]|mgnify:CR=1 FL=1
MTAAQPKPRQLRESATHITTEPTWEITYLFPWQGTWSEDDYMALRPSRIIEYSHGHLEVHDVPSQSHQFIVAYLFQALVAFVAARKLGTVLFAPLRLKLWEEKYREPDIVFMSAEHAARRGEDFWLGADLVMEVVSEDDQSRERALQKKRSEHAQAGILEYWIINPPERRIVVLRLEEGQYKVHGEFAPGTSAASALLNGFAVEVAAIFAAAEL